jgi:hypothetical protein
VAVYPQRLSRLLLITPGLITVDHDEADAPLDARLAERSGEQYRAWEHHTGVSARGRPPPSLAAPPSHRQQAARSGFR